MRIWTAKAELKVLQIYRPQGSKRQGPTQSKPLLKNQV